jgi:hypothetical protein
VTAPLKSGIAVAAVLRALVSQVSQ